MPYVPYRTPPSTGRSTVSRQTSGRSARRLLFRRVTNAGVYKLGKKLFSGVKRKLFKKRVKPTGLMTRKNFGGMSTAVYKGKFKKPRVLKQSIETKCLSQGYHKTIEQFGSIADPNSVYLMHSTVNTIQVCYTIAAAAMRKVMTMAGFKVTANFNELSVTDNVTGATEQTDSDGLRFVVWTREAVTGVTNQIGFNTVNNQTFNDITSFGFGVPGAFTDLPDQFINYMRNQSSAVPYKLAVYKKDYQSVVGFTWILGAELYFEDAHLQLFIDSQLTIQNRTKGATTGADQDADRVDNQPLQGWIYEFKHADPRLRHSGPISGGTNSNLLFGRIDERGIDLIKGGEYVNANEPFQPKYFSNIDKATKIRMQSGEMKKTSFSYVFSGTFKNILKKLRCEKLNVTGPVAEISGLPGKCQMVCLEEVMRTATDNFITIAYERQQKIGAIVKPTKPQALLETKLFAQQIDAV